MASRYPKGFDTDVEIPRIDNNVTEIGGDAINGLRDAVFTLEKILGLNVQGSATDLVTRLNKTLDANGNLKATAISTLWSGSPIMNSHIANNAGIKETKLTLDYGTTQLKTWIDTLRVRVDALYKSIAQDITNLSRHIGHPSSYGRHRTSDIDGYFTLQTPYTNYNLQGIIHDLFDKITDHVAEITDAHDASAISVDDSTFFSASGDDVQEVLESLDHLEMRELTRHRDRQHSNGILNTQETFYNNTHYNTVVVASSTLLAQSIGTKLVRFIVSPAGFVDVKRDDTIVIINSGISYTFKIDRTDTILGTAYVYIQGSMPVAILLGATAIIYRSTEETASSSVLINVIKKRTTSANNSIIAVHPKAPYVIGSGLNPGLLATGSMENIRIDWSSYGYNGSYEFDLEALLPAAFEDRTPQVIVDTLNTEFTDNCLPLLAFLYKNEIGIALDEAPLDGYIGIKTPMSNSAWPALGFAEEVNWYTLADRNSYIDGYEANTLTELINSSATLAGNVITFSTINPIALGITIGQFVRVFNGVDDGTYEISAISSNSISVAIVGVFVGATAIVRVYADSFYELPILRTFYETYVDVSKTTKNLYFRVAPRLRYSDDGGTVGQPFEEKANITAVSRNFSHSTMRIVFLTATNTLQLGEPTGVGIGLLAGTEGPAVVIPADPRGKIIKLYDHSRTEYIELQMIAVPAASNGILNCYIEDRISEEFHLQTGTVLNNKTLFLNATDNRLFGNVGRQDIRTDFKRDYTSYPLSRIRANGIIYGFNFEASGVTEVLAYGGEVLVNGAIKNASTKAITIPTDTSGLNITYNLFVDEDGVFNFLVDDRVVNFTPSLEEIIISEDKVIIGQIITNNGSFVSSTDLRRFVNNLDNKIELIVEDEDISVGSFATLQSAVNWINAVDQTLFPTSKTIRIRGSITYDVSILGSTTLPDGITLIGDGDGSNSTYGSRIYVTNNIAGTSILIPQDNCTIKNIAFEADASSTDMQNGFIGDSTISVANLRIEGCSFTYPSQSSLFYGIGVDQFYELFINDCKFINCGTGIINVTSGAILNISNCLFSACYDYGIFLTSVVNGNIRHNQMAFTTLNGSTDAIRINSAFRINISDNIILSTSIDIASANRIMIVVDVASTFTQIHNNILINSSVASQGFGLGILYGSSGVGVFDHNYVDISRNKLQYFYGGVFQKGITVLKSTNVEIVKNKILNCRNAIDIADAADPCTKISITNNIAEVVGSGIALLRVRTGGGLTNNLRVVGNHFHASADPLYHLVDITAFGYSVISNNILEIDTDIAFSAIYFAGSRSTISGNIIWGQNFTNAANSPLQIVGTSNYSSGNNIGVISTAAPSTAISLSGTANTEELNKGASYSINIPLSNAMTSRDNAGSSSWVQGIDIATGAYLYSSFVTWVGSGVNADYANYYFDRNNVPIGANIISVEILYNLTGAGVVVGDLKMGWYKTTSLSIVLTTISAAADVSNIGLGQIETITPAVTEYMGAQDVHFVYIEPQGFAGAQILYIWGMRVNYTL